MPEIERSRPPVLGPAPDPRLPAIRRDRLANGLGLVLVPARRVPVAVLEMIVGAGSARDGSGCAGLADLTVHLLPEGAAGMGVLEIAERLAGIGATLSVGATYDVARLRILVLRANVEEALRILADLLLRASFPSDELERLRAEREIDLLRSTDDPAVVANRAFAAELYGEHPYGAPEEGTIASVRALTREAFLQLYQEAYRPGNAVLVAAGDIDLGGLGSDAERAFGRWPPATPPSIDISPPDRPGRGIVLVDRPGSAQSEIRVGHVGVPYAHPDAIPLRVLNHLLGGAFTSRINLNLRERRGWTYGVRSRFEFRRGAGPFIIGTSVATAVTRPAIEEIRLELERIREEPIAEEERALAVNGLTLGLPLVFQTPGQIADRVREIVVYNLPDQWWNTIADRYRSVTVEDLEFAARTHLRPADLLTVVVGDAAVIGQDLAALGPVTTRVWKPAMRRDVERD
jgi:zinc protease